MAQLIYATNVTLDGYIEDESGAFDFLPVDVERRRVHEVMAPDHPFATSCRHARIEGDRLAAHDFARKERSRDECVERRWRSGGMSL